jgi:hypothetical protein
MTSEEAYAEIARTMAHITRGAQGTPQRLFYGVCQVNLEYYLGVTYLSLNPPKAVMEILQEAKDSVRGHYPDFEPEVDFTSRIDE